MPEVQSHGFTWERDIQTKVYSLSEKDIKEIGYTNKADIPASYNKLDHVDVSIKTTSDPNCVCMADCLRVYDSLDSPLHLIVVQYEQCDLTNRKCLKTVTHINLTNCKTILFGDLTREEIAELDATVKRVPQKRSPTLEEYQEMYSLKKKLQEKSGFIRLDIKCNSQQSRLQCSITKFKTFLMEHSNKILFKSDGFTFRNAILQEDIDSRRRKFNKKIRDLCL